MSIQMPDVKDAMRLAFGKCPRCGQRLTYGNWLRWCTKRGCMWVGPQRETKDLDDN
jgi:uncharacterized protein (DUF983 family)